MKLPKTLPKPVLPNNLTDDAQWLAGEGAGSWYQLKWLAGNQYEVERFSFDGRVECQGIYQSDRELDVTSIYTFTYPSNCNKVTIQQGEVIITMHLEQG